MPHSYLKVVGNHRCRCNNSSPRYSVRTTMLSLHLIENFLRFQVQDKHNASYFSNMSWKELPQYKHKNRVFCDNLLFSNNSFNEKRGMCNIIYTYIRIHLRVFPFITPEQHHSLTLKIIPEIFRNFEAYSAINVNELIVTTNTIIVHIKEKQNNQTIIFNLSSTK